MENKVLDYDRDWQKILDKLTFIEDANARELAFSEFIWKHCMA